MSPFRRPSSHFCRAKTRGPQQMWLTCLWSKESGGKLPDERGAIGGIEGLAFGVLIFAFGTLMVVNAWAVVDGKMTASAAAREATRTYVEAPNQVDGNREAQEAAADVARGKANPQLQLYFATASGARAFNRCQQVTATVRIAVPRVSLPLIGGRGGTFPVSATHTEVIDPYRSGLSSTTSC